MPGPSATESMWAPEMIVRSVRPVVVSAITLGVSSDLVSVGADKGARVAFGWSTRYLPAA